jgi:hypothetical protein
MRSISSCVKEFLEGQVKGYTFDVNSLQVKLEADERFMGVGFTQGAVSGFCSRLVDNEILSYVDDADIRRYTLVGDISSIRVKNTSTPGGTLGKQDGAHRTRRRPTVASLAERLFEIAADIEKLQPSLSIVSTKDLLDELQRRTEKQVV